MTILRFTAVGSGKEQLDVPHHARVLSVQREPDGFGGYVLAIYVLGNVSHAPETLTIETFHTDQVIEPWPRRRHVGSWSEDGRTRHTFLRLAAAGTIQ